MTFDLLAYMIVLLALGEFLIKAGAVLAVFYFAYRLIRKVYMKNESE